MKLFNLILFGVLAILLTHTISAAQFYACDTESQNLGSITQPFNTFAATELMAVGDDLAICGDCVPSLVTDGLTNGEYVVRDSTAEVIASSPDQAEMEQLVISLLSFNPDEVYQITGGDNSITTGRCQ